jgi:predicted nucleic acid-binding protein
MKGIFAVDASILIELLLLTERGKNIQNSLIDENLFFYTTKYAIFETKYILCRHLNWNEANVRVEKLINSNYITILENEDINNNGVQFKCQRSISLPDALVLGLAKYLEISALFANEEKELIETVNNKFIEVEIQFLH